MHDACPRTLYVERATCAHLNRSCRSFLRRVRVHALVGLDCEAGGTVFLAYFAAGSDTVETYLRRSQNRRLSLLFKADLVSPFHGKYYLSLVLGKTNTLSGTEISQRAHTCLEIGVDLTKLARELAMHAAAQMAKVAAPIPRFVAVGLICHCLCRHA